MYPIDVLIADDDDEMVCCIGEALDLEGLTWRRVRNGRECLTALLAHRYSTLLLDLSRPVTRGHEVLTWLHERSCARAITVLIFSATAQDAPCCRSDRHRVLRKPCELLDLIRAIKAALAAAQAQRVG